MKSEIHSLKRGVCMQLQKDVNRYATAVLEDKPNTQWFDVRKPPFALYGLYEPQKGDAFCRMPKQIAETVSKDVAALALHTAGGRCRFSTDSPYIAIRAVMPGQSFMGHMAAVGSSGFDLYADTPEGSVFVTSFMPDLTCPGGIIASRAIEGTRFAGKVNHYTVHFPLYAGVETLEIGILQGSTLGAGAAYKDVRPILYYGSSITQGGCASRPGISYQGYISRRFQTDHINLGFSGSAKGEQTMVDYICAQDISLFVCDYDHNESNAESLRKKHYNVYACFRQKQPQTPILLISRPDVFLCPDDAAARVQVVRETYERALASGDRNVYFVDGGTLFDGADASDCTVDSCHPNDLGFYRMAQVIGDKIAEINPFVCR